MSNVHNGAQADRHCFLPDKGHGIDLDVTRAQAAKRLRDSGQSTRIHKHPYGENCFRYSHEDFGNVTFAIAERSVFETITIPTTNQVSLG